MQRIIGIVDDDDTCFRDDDVTKENEGKGRGRRMWDNRQSGKFASNKNLTRKKGNAVQNWRDDKFYDSESIKWICYKE